MIVWVLIFYMARWTGEGGPAVIDNIASREECMKLKATLDHNRYRADGRAAFARAECLPVRKVRP